MPDKMKMRYALYMGRFEHPDERSKAVLLQQFRTLAIAKAMMIKLFHSKKLNCFIVDLRVQAVVGAVWCLTQEIVQ